MCGFVGWRGRRVGGKRSFYFIIGLFALIIGLFALRATYYVNSREYPAIALAS
jgi:hypothetical protein